MIKTKLHIFHYILKLNLRRFKTEENSYNLTKYLKSIFKYFFFDVFVFVFEEFFEKHFCLCLYLLIEKTVILNTNTFYFKKLSSYEVYF